MAWPWQSYPLLQAENWKLIAGSDILVLKLKSVYSDFCHCFLLFFFSAAGRKYLFNFINLGFKPLTCRAVLEGAEYNEFFPSAPQPCPLGDEALAQLPAGSHLSLLVTWFSSLWSQWDSLLISVELYCTFSKFSVSFLCTKTLGFAIRLITIFWGARFYKLKNSFSTYWNQWDSQEVLSWKFNTPSVSCFLQQP